jgi:hypothetical protein
MVPARINELAMAITYLRSDDMDQTARKHIATNCGFNGGQKRLIAIKAWNSQKENRRDRLTYPAYFKPPYYGRVKNQALRPCVAA